MRGLRFPLHGTLLDTNFEPANIFQKCLYIFLYDDIPTYIDTPIQNQEIFVLINKYQNNSSTCS